MFGLFGLALWVQNWVLDVSKFGGFMRFQNISFCQKWQNLIMYCQFCPIFIIKNEINFIVYTRPTLIVIMFNFKNMRSYWKYILSFIQFHSSRGTIYLHVSMIIFITYHKIKLPFSKFAIFWPTYPPLCPYVISKWSQMKILSLIKYCSNNWDSSFVIPWFCVKTCMVPG